MSGPKRGCPRTRGVARGGFTLAEMLVALVVVGVAATLFISSFLAANRLVQESTSSNVAIELAAERLGDIQLHPDHYQWPEIKAGELAELKPKNPDMIVEGFEPPATLPPLKDEGKREVNFYRSFLWKAYVRMPAEKDADYLEVIVLVSRPIQGQTSHVTLTTCVPRSAAGGAV